MSIPIATLTVDMDGLKRLGKEFLDALPGSTVEEAENGMKCFGLAYLNLTEGSYRDELEAPLLYSIIARKFFEHTIPLEILRGY